jgi:hypothetical protein
MKTSSIDIAKGAAIWGTVLTLPMFYAHLENADPWLNLFYSLVIYPVFLLLLSRQSAFVIDEPVMIYTCLITFGITYLFSMLPKYDEELQKSSWWPRVGMILTFILVLALMSSFVKPMYNARNFSYA